MIEGATIGKEIALDGSVIRQKELSILEQLSHGNSNLEIARNLKISERTVEAYRQKLLAKTKCNTMIHLIAEAIRKGWIS